MKTKRLVPLILLFLLSCTASEVLVETVHDEFFKSRINRMTGNTLPETTPPDNTTIELNAEIYRSEDGNILYSLIVEYSSDDWLFIRQGEFLLLTVDQKRIELKGEGSSAHRNIQYGGRLTEKAWYGISLEGLKTVADAQRVKATIVGSRRQIDRTLSEKNLVRFRLFIAKYGP
jgi:hypothetical protein